MSDKLENFKRLGCKVCGEVFFISPEAYKGRTWSYCPDCGNEVYKK